MQQKDSTIIVKRSFAATAASSLSLDSEEDPLAADYGNIPLLELQSKTVADVHDWTEVEALINYLVNQGVLIRGRLQSIRALGKKIAFLFIREKGYTVQCVVELADHVSPQMVKYATALSRESTVDLLKGSSQSQCSAILSKARHSRWKLK